MLTLDELELVAIAAEGYPAGHGRDYYADLPTAPAWPVVDAYNLGEIVLARC
jgi:hypothetical protein